MTRPPQPRPLRQRYPDGPRNTGRPTKFTPEMTARFLAVIAQGNWRTTACSVVGINKVTLWQWLQKAKAETAGPYRDFLDELVRLEGQVEAKVVENWVTATRTDWRAGQAFLALRWTRRWGQPTKVELSTPDGKPLQVEHQHRLDLSRLSDADLLQLREIAQRAQPVPLQITSTTHDALPD